MSMKNKVLGYSEAIGVYELVENPNAKTSDQAFIMNKFELERGAGENYMRFSLVSRHLRWLMGEVLTVVDASISNERQLKAAKDLIKKDFASKIGWLYEQCGMPEDEQDALLMVNEE